MDKAEYLRMAGTEQLHMWVLEDVGGVASARRAREREGIVLSREGGGGAPSFPGGGIVFPGGAPPFPGEAILPREALSIPERDTTFSNEDSVFPGYLELRSPHDLRFLNKEEASILKCSCGDPLLTQSACARSNNLRRPFCSRCELFPIALIMEITVPDLCMKAYSTIFKPSNTRKTENRRLLSHSVWSLFFRELFHFGSRQWQRSQPERGPGLYSRDWSLKSIRILHVGSENRDIHWPQQSLDKGGWTKYKVSNT